MRTRRRDGSLHALRWYVGLLIENARVILPFSLGHLFRVKDPQFRVPPSEEIECACTPIVDPLGTIAEISFSGRYPPGSFGNPHASRMIFFAREAIEKNSPSAVLFDLRRLNYTWGDAITDLARTVRDPETRRVLPACLLAKGRTATALEGLIRFAGRNMDLPLFLDREEALQHLRSRLAGRNG